MSTEENSRSHDDHQDHEHGSQLVTVKINGKDVRIHRGRQSVAQLKVTGHVEPAEELEQVINGVFTPLPDDGSVVIKGGEVFVSHVRASAGS
jgi:hypothetical protein